MDLKFDVVEISVPTGMNVIVGQSHFIKTVEDIYEAIVSTAPHIKFGLAFCEASGKRLIRSEGNDEALVKMAEEAAQKISAGHSFIIYLREGYPINILNAIKMVPEVVRIFAATGNPLQILIGETQQGRGIIGVVDGETPLGVESEEDKKERKKFLREIGYKLGEA